MIEEVQQKLSIPVSGILDRVTKAAIKKFQRIKGLNETGNLDVRTQQILGLRSIDIPVNPNTSKIPIVPLYLQNPLQPRHFVPNKAVIGISTLTPFESVMYWERSTAINLGYQYGIYNGKIYQYHTDEFWGYHLQHDGRPDANEKSLGICMHSPAGELENYVALSNLICMLQDEYDFDLVGVDQLAYQKGLPLDAWIPQLKNLEYGGVWLQENFTQEGSAYIGVLSYMSDLFSDTWKRREEISFKRQR